MRHATGSFPTSLGPLPPSHRDFSEVGSSILGGVHEPAHGPSSPTDKTETHLSMQWPIIGFRRPKGEAGPAKLRIIAKPKTERGLDGLTKETTWHGMLVWDPL